MLGEADRERLEALRAYMAFHWPSQWRCRIDDRTRLVEHGETICHCDSGTESADMARPKWARAEIARLEALDAEPVSAPIDRVRQAVEDGRIILKPSSKLLEAFAEEACADDEPKPKPKSKLAVQSLDDFMRQRDDADERRRALERAPACRISERAELGLAGEEDSEQSNRPASRELVERMVREATAHSKWPVSFWQSDDQDGEPHYKMSIKGPLGWIDMNLAYGAWSHFEAPHSTTMVALLEACDEAKAFVDYHNHRACPACDGKGKTRGELMWGEQDCHACEGSGLR